MFDGRPRVGGVAQDVESVTHVAAGFVSRVRVEKGETN